MAQDVQPFGNAGILVFGAYVGVMFLLIFVKFCLCINIVFLWILEQCDFWNSLILEQCHFWNSVIVEQCGFGTV
jgi:hypothetical protein